MSLTLEKVHSKSVRMNNPVEKGKKMRLEKWKTPVIGVGPWMVSDNEGPSSMTLAQFRKEEHADIFIKALEGNLRSDEREREIKLKTQVFCFASPRM